MMDIHYLSVKEVISINILIIKKYSPSEQIGLLSQSLLESAVYRLQQSAFGKDAYPTIIEKAAALFESLGQNHSFHNANKRTAFRVSGISSPTICLRQGRLSHDYRKSRRVI